MARLHLDALGVHLTELTKAQADYLGVGVEGPVQARPLPLLMSDAPPPSWGGPPAGGPPPPFVLPGPAAYPLTPWPGAPATAVEQWRLGVPLRMPRWGFGDAWIALVAAFVLSASAGVLLVLAQGSRTATNVVVLVSLALQWIPMVGWPWLATRRRGNGLRTDLGLAINGADVGIGLVGGFASLVIAAAVAALTQMVFGPFDSAAGELVDDFTKDKLLLYVLVVSIAFIAPVVEEICFRGLFWGSLAKRGMNQYWVTFWTALAFACFHLEPVRIPLLLCTGLVLGFLRQKTGRLGAPIVAHMVNNSVAALGILFM